MKASPFSPPARRGASRGLTLLEVLVAVSILGLGLTIILSSQAGLFASTQRAEHVTVAANLVRCKMSEVELELLEDGYPMIDRQERGDCCQDEPFGRYSCEWKIEPVELPQPASFAGEPGGEEPSETPSSLGAPGKSSDSLELGPLGALMDIQKSGGANLGESPDLGELAGALTGDTGGGAMGLASTAMQLVYPSLKDMLEASIRKVTVRVIWTEGQSERDMVAVQYVTNPVEGGLNPNAADDLPELPGGTGPATQGGEP